MEIMKDVFVITKTYKITGEKDVVGIYEDEEHCKVSCKGFEERYKDYNFVYEQFNVIVPHKLKQ